MYPPVPFNSQDEYEESSEERSLEGSVKNGRDLSSQMDDTEFDETRQIKWMKTFNSPNVAPLHSFLTTLKKKLKEWEDEQQRHQQRDGQATDVASKRDRGETLKANFLGSRRGTRRTNTKSPLRCRGCIHDTVKNTTSKRQGRDDHGWLIAYGKK